jgi:hypothetical protein
VKFVEDSNGENCQFPYLYSVTHVKSKGISLYLLSCATVLKSSFELIGSSTCESWKERFNMLDEGPMTYDQHHTQSLNADRYQWKRRPKYWHLTPSSSSPKEYRRCCPAMYDCVKMIEKASEAKRFICFLHLLFNRPCILNLILLLWMCGGKAMYISNEW